MLDGDLVHRRREIERDIGLHIAVGEELAGELAGAGAELEDAELRIEPSEAQNAAKKRGRYGRLIRVSSIQVRAVAGSRKSTRIGISSSSLVMSRLRPRVPLKEPQAVLQALGRR